MMKKWGFSVKSLLIFLQIVCVNCSMEMCNYIVRKSDNSSERCLMNECLKYVDILSMMVEPKTCKTSLVVLAFSSFEKFVLFRDQLKWKIGDLFPSKRINENRQLILYFDQLNANDRPIDHHQLIQLGNHIDHLILHFKFIENQTLYHGLIHSDPNNLQWKTIQVKLYVLLLIFHTKNLFLFRLVDVVN